MATPPREPSAGSAANKVTLPTLFAKVADGKPITIGVNVYTRAI